MSPAEGGTGSSAGPESGAAGDALAKARAAKEEMRDRFAAEPRVLGVGIGGDDTGGYVVEVRLSEASVLELIPSTVQTVRVQTRVVGSIRPQGPDSPGSP